MSSIGAREELPRIGNVLQKMWKIQWKFEFLTIFQKWSQINPELFQDQKNNIFMQKAMIFK